MMISGAVLLLLLISTITPKSTGVVVTDCGACHVNATCSSSQGAKEEIVTCSCKAGFVGDGLACSLPRSKRSSGPDSNQNSVLFSCGGVACPAGQDCLTVNGNEQCLDPCQDYSRLDDAWRATDFRDGSLRCDRNLNWQGWYRLFLGDASVQMPERCVDKNMCGTHAPLWLNTSHPAPSDGIVQSRVCGHWGNDCCQFPSNPIHVRACPGNYFVYKFVDPTICHSAYCADVNTAVCGTCREDETCVSEDKVNWRCERRERPIFPDPELVCGRSILQVGLDRAVLEAGGLDVSSAHLADSRCTEHQESRGIVWFHVEHREGSCGTQLRTNATHATYSNTLFVYPVTVGNRSFNAPESFPFSCSYPLDSQTSLDVAIRPYLEEAKSVGLGSRARAAMFIYRNANYTDPYSVGPVVLPLGSALHVGVSVEEDDLNGFAVILEECYATPSADPEDPERFFLIQNRCPSDRRLVKVEPSGPSLPGRFSAFLSLFTGDYDDVFLHCSLSMCDHTQASCSQ
ncbi:hypothetical protein AAFF_G00348420, partial [Aldrovandia affinis]